MLKAVVLFKNAHKFGSFIFVQLESLESALIELDTSKLLVCYLLPETQNVSNKSKGFFQ
jgi:hypothetical protein